MSRLVYYARVCVSLLVTLLFPLDAAAEDVAVSAGTVHTMAAAGQMRDVVLLIEDGRLTAIGKDVVVPEGISVIDATDKIVTPGFIESYSQLGLAEVEYERTAVDAVVEEYAAGPSFDVQYAINSNSTVIAVNRVEGVTHAVVAPTPGNDPFAGWASFIRLTDDNALVATQMAMFANLSLDVIDFVGGSRAAAVQRISDALALAPRFRAHRYVPHVRDYPRQDMAALKQFLGSGRPLVIKANRANEIRQAIGIAARAEVPLVILEGAEAWQVAEELADVDAAVIVDVFDNLPSSFDQLGARLDNATLLHRAGVTVLLTSGETQNARWLRQIAGNAVAQGLPWQAALAALTSHPARVWSLPKGIGAIETGGIANLVIWTGDPLELTSWPERVMIAGEWQSPESRQTELLRRYRDLDTAQPYGYR